MILRITVENEEGHAWVEKTFQVNRGTGWDNETYYTILSLDDKTPIDLAGIVEEAQNKINSWDS